MKREVGSFQVAGVTFEGRQELLEKLQMDYIRNPDKKTVDFKSEPENQYDVNAIAVWVDIEGELKKIGYVPKAINLNFKEILNSGKFIRAKITSVANFEGGPLGAKVMFEIDIDEEETIEE